MVARGVNMTENLRRVAAEITALDRLPAGLVVNGDCAYGMGLPGDYATFLAGVRPLADAGIPLHFSMGNHDHRENFRAGMLPGAGKSLLEGKLVSVVEGKRANWFILDTLDRTNVTPGVLGEAQLKWVKQALDARADRPALVMIHHNPAFEAGKTGGLVDTQELFDLLVPRKHVKALVFGHTHHWEIREREGIHLVNLPPVGYPFQQADPSGWVDVKLTGSGATLELRALVPAHPAHGKKTELRWRE
jgi:3',5'-cyclic AMP phosphodiesterase CpdA